VKKCGIVPSVWQGRIDEACEIAIQRQIALGGIAAVAGITRAQRAASAVCDTPYHPTE